MDELGDIEGMEDFSMEDLEKDLKKGRGGRRWLWFLIGLVFGVGGTIAAPMFLADYLPESLRPGGEILSGPVLAEERTEDRVLLTIAAEPGALIASFSQRVDEIALLVEPGDVVTIAVPDYEPFVEDPDFEGVQKRADVEGADIEGDDSENSDEAGAGDAEGDAAEGQDPEGNDPEGGESDGSGDPDSGATGEERDEADGAASEEQTGEAAADTTAASAR